jgi:hypothetical protein
VLGYRHPYRAFELIVFARKTLFALIVVLIPAQFATLQVALLFVLYVVYLAFVLVWYVSLTPPSLA